MAKVTISSDTVLDASGYVSGDYFTVEAGATLTIDAPNLGADPIDGRYGYYFSILELGELHVDGTKIRRLDYSDGSGIAPVSGETIVGATSGATGEIVGVEGTGTAGYVLIREVTVAAFQGGESLTGTSATGIMANGVDRVGYLAFATQQNRSSDVIYGSGQATVTGEWYELGEGDGTSAQTIDFYTTAQCCMLEVETSSGSGVYEKWINQGYDWGLAGRECGTGELGNFFYHGFGSSTITFGDGVNGNMPPNGAKIRVPNVTWCETDSGTYPGIMLTASINYRLEFTTRNLHLDKFNVTADIYANIALLYLHDVGVNSYVNQGTLLSEAADIDGLVICADYNSIAARYFVLSNSDSHSITNLYVYCTQTSTSSSYECKLYNSVNTTLNNLFFFSAVREFKLEYCDGVVMNDPVTVQRGIVLLHSSNTRAYNQKFSGTMDGIRDSGLNYYAFNAQGSGTNNRLDGLIVHPDGCVGYNYPISADGVCDIQYRNVGSQAAPYDLDNFGENAIYARSFKLLEVYRCYFTNPRSTAVDWGSGGIRSESRFINFVCDDTTMDYKVESKDNTMWRSTRLTYTDLGYDIGDISYYNPGIGSSFFDGFKSDTEGSLMLLPARKGGVTDAYVSVLGDATMDAQWIRLGSLAGGGSIEWEWPYQIMGQDSFQNSDAYKENSGVFPSDITIEYQIDTGSGYSAWKDATAANLFGESISPSGFKFKVRITADDSSATSFRGIEFKTTTSLASQTNYLPEIDLATLTVDNIVVGSVYEIYNETQQSQILVATATATTELIGISANDNDVIRVRVRKSSGGTKYKAYTGFATVVTGLASAYISQIEDPVAA